MINNKNTELIDSYERLRKLIGMPSEQALKKSQLALSPEHKNSSLNPHFF